MVDNDKADVDKADVDKVDASLAGVPVPESEVAADLGYASVAAMRFHHDLWELNPCRPPPGWRFRRSGEPFDLKQAIYWHDDECRWRHFDRDNGYTANASWAVPDSPADMPVLVCMVGLPRSGKSTWAAKKSALYGYPVVSPDAVRLALTGQTFFGGAEPTVWATARLMVEALFRTGVRTVILDATNMTRARRNQWVSTSWCCLFKPIATSTAQCLARARAGGRDDLVPVIERMAREAEPLNPTEMAALWDAGDASFV